MPSKRKNQINHARVRGIQRQGINLTASVNALLVEQIQEGKSKHLYKVSNRLVAHRVTYEDKKFPVLYDRMRKTIVTVLPDNHLET